MPRSDFDEFCKEAFGFLSDCEVEYLVIGGLAVLAVGEPRTTADADVVAFLSTVEAEKLIDRAERSGFDVKAELERERLHRTGTLRFRKGSFQVDLILASLPFEERALEERQG